MNKSLIKTRTFTLIEMLIVIVIIGILAAALVPRLTDVQGRARNVKRKTDITTLTNAIMIYHSDYGNYPRGLGHLVTGNVMTSLPSDPLMSVRHPCSFRTGLWGGPPMASGYYLSSGYYNDASNCPGGLENCSSAHYGYMYTSCAAGSQCKYAYIGAGMEDDGSTNSYGNNVGTGVHLACNRGNNYSERGLRGAYGKYDAWSHVINEMRGGMNSRGKLYLHIFENGNLLF